jgi:hypothetical protein
MKLTAGMKTSEFLLALVANVIAVLDYAHVWTVAPKGYVVLLQAAVSGLYALSRGWAKSGSTVNATK